MFGRYTFSYGKAAKGLFSLNFTAGVNLLDMINISYSLRTNFKAASNKFAVGYVYRY